jgi:uncharacterized cupredoxin-like copper-binding protein
VLLAALSTGQKVGLGLVGLAFVAFALVSAFVIPAFRPDFPGRRGLPAFLTVSVALFVGMMSAVFFFGREPAEGKAAAAGSTAAETTQASPTTSQTQTSSAPTTQATSTSGTTTRKQAAAPPPKAQQKVTVTETEFKIALPSQSLKAGPYELDVENKGKIGHDLVVKGPGVNDQKTPLIDGGKTAVLKVDLKQGTYELYCSVPGHKQAGMDVKVTVT